MAKDPAFLFYPKDWLEGTGEMMPDEKGIYIDLLCYQHQRGSLPTDEKRLAKMVGLSLDEFLESWEIIKSKFDRMDDRLVNQRLAQEVAERKVKSQKNKVIGIFASLLRTGNYDKKTYKFIREGFNVADYTDTDTERITERLTEWIGKRSKSIASASASASEDKYVLDFNYDIRYKGVIEQWFDYKKERGETYKSKLGRQKFYNNLHEFANGDIRMAQKIIDQSMANNWAGIFELKSDPQKQDRDRRINDPWENEPGTNIK